MKDLYSILNVTKDTSISDIKKSYKKLRKFSPFDYRFKSDPNET
jgi:DnaJ-class molecular chaperone